MDDLKPAQPGTAPDNRALVMRFESLGGSGHGCEFGLFQRHFDAEPLGLLRWADLDHELLIKALETRFAGVGELENTVVFNPDNSEEWWTRDTRFWMAMRSFVKVADVDLETMKKKACRRLQFLRRKLIEDLEAGEKIFVYKNAQRDLTAGELKRLHDAVRAYGDPTLFYIQYADAAHPGGTVEVRAPGLLVGYIDHFAFSREDKPLGPVNDLFYALCKQAYQIFAGEAPRPALASPALLPPRNRKVVVIGNCQAHAMMGLYEKFVANHTGEKLEYLASYTDLTADDRATLEQADLIVEQLFDLKQQADVAGVAPGTPRLFIPMVTAGFLWPFAGQPHPKNREYPFLTGGPYGGEAADSYLNRQILAGVDPEEAVEAYMQLDVRARTNLDRMYELLMDRQRSRDEASGYRIANLIERHFRTEQIFLSPYHPNTRIAVELATQFFRQMGAQPNDIARMETRTTRTPFPKEELPIHPSVCKHFGLDFITADRRYRFMYEGRFTFREYALRYMRYEWNEALEEGRSLVQRGDFAAAYGKLIEGLARSPDSAHAHHDLSLVLAHQNQRQEAIVESRRAVEIEPDYPPYHSQLGMLLWHNGRLDEAEAELRAAVAADPADPHYLILLAHLMRHRGRIDEGCALVREAIWLDPYSARLNEELSSFLESKSDWAGAIVALQQGMALNEDVTAYLPRLAHLLSRAERLPEAEQVLRTAIARNPMIARIRVSLSDILLRQGKLLEAQYEALMAAVIDNESVDAYSHLGHVLYQKRDPVAEVALLRAAGLDPGNANVRHQLSDVYFAAGRVQDAILAATQATELEPANAHRFAHLARMLLQADDLAGAVTAQQEAVRLGPTDTVLRIILSDLYARLGRLGEALEEAQAATDLQPDSAHALGHLAHVLQLMGRLDQSEKLFFRAIALQPDSEHLRSQLSHVQDRRAQLLSA